MSAKKLIKVKPQAFIHDERSSIGMAVFQEEETKSKFTVSVDSFVNLDLFLRESFKRQESGFSLSYSFMKSFDYEIDIALLDIKSDGSSKIIVYLKHTNESSEPLKEIDLKIFELLGLWNTKEFDIFASSEFIDTSKNIVLDDLKASDPGLKNLHKKYGQKYLI